MKIIKSLGLCLFFLLSFLNVEAHVGPKDPNAPKPKNDKPSVSYREDCTLPEAQVDQDINNVRARLKTAGDVWWDGNTNGRYIVPKPPPGEDEVSSIFSGSVWLGGFDPEGNLKLAAGQYTGSNNFDFFTGPLDPFMGVTDLPICENWDRFFEVDGDDIRNVARIFDGNDGAIPCDSVTTGVRYWPGRGNPLERFDFELPDTGQGLAAFWDEDQDGVYNPCNGDLPIIDIRGCFPDNRQQAIELVPDQMFFWIYNDAGGPHTESFGDAIQMEVQVQAFAYATNDEINDMTFQRYKLINRAESDIRDCYFAMWVDGDLGCDQDDYIGCDIDRSLAYLYNEDIVDGSTGDICASGANTYGTEIPILGIDYFRGPLAPHFIVPEGQGDLHVIANADEDFDKDQYAIGDTVFIVDVLLEDTEEADILVELGMSSFVYTNRAGAGTWPAGTTDPNTAEEFYNLLTGSWRDGTPFTFGGSGYEPGSTDLINFAFPGLPSSETDWSMCSAELGFGDRRTIQASGPFLLNPGAVNELIIGAVWVPNIVYPCPDISRLQTADDLAQALFDNCFDITDGPDAPDVCAVELDQEVVLVLSNDEIQSNNPNLQYQEKDLLVPDGVSDSLYVFEGYKIYQLVNAVVTPQELDDIEKARLIRQVDLKNGITEIFNWEADINPLTEERIWNFEREVDGADQGISNTIRVTQDQFADGADTRLINHQEYYFMALAYAHNNWQDWVTNPIDTLFETGQRTPYLEGRGNIQVYTVVPRPIVYTNISSNYGDGPIVTRLAGEGVGDNVLDVVEGTYDDILNGTANGEVTYTSEGSPIDVIIYNPLEVQAASFILEFVGEVENSSACTLAEGTRWQLVNEETSEVVASESTIDALNEQLITDFGFSVSIQQTEDAGVNPENGNGALGSEVRYADSSQPNWFLGISDDGASLDAQGFLRQIYNFLKTGGGELDESIDPNQEYSTNGTGFFYPFSICDFRNPDPANAEVPYISPGYVENNGGGFLRSATDLGDLNNVDIIMTSDRSKWSRCVVVETCNQFHRMDGLIPEGGMRQFDLRAGASVDQNGQADGDGTGMGWFPGYAIDVETGLRVNIFFGENSGYNDNFTYDSGVAVGNDMLYNPDSQIMIETGGGFALSNFYLGGGHQVFVTRSPYDGCSSLRDDLEGPCNFLCFQKNNPLSLVTWTSMAMTAPGTTLNSLADGLIPNELTVKLRVSNNYNAERIVDYGIAMDCRRLDELPRYRLDFTQLAASDLTQEEYEGVLESVNVVPNPYYAYSEYESDQFDNTVKITNLPGNTTVTIYSIDGKFIRQFRRNEVSRPKGGNNPGVPNSQVAPDIEWDLENFAGIPVASGVYLIHVAAPEIGEERTIKWFGVHRQFDPSGL